MRILILLLFASVGLQAAEIVASSASQADVQTAVDAAANGDTVLIPNGSSTWTSGINTTKQIIIRAQNYTPTSGGNTTRNVTITNNSTTIPLFQFASGSSFHVGLGGIRFNEGSGDRNYVRFTGSGSKPPLLFDCYFEIGERQGSQPDIGYVQFLSLGGVMWNCYAIGVETAGGSQTLGPQGPSFLINSPRAWTTASTMGDADTGGLVNVYYEDCTFIRVGQCPDVDDNGRWVCRYSTLDGAGGGTHGFTSAVGGRHIEFYNCTFSTTDELRNHNGRYFWFRAGTGIVTDCVINNAAFPGAYGTPSMLNFGDNTNPTGYPQERQPGWGHNGTSHVIDPVYMWNNTGARADTFTVQSSPNDWTTNVQEDREVYAGTAKPGYAKFTYPHPLRATIEGGGGGGGGATIGTLNVQNLTIGQ